MKKTIETATETILCKRIKTLENIIDQQSCENLDLKETVQKHALRLQRISGTLMDPDSTIETVRAVYESGIKTTQRS